MDPVEIIRRFVDPDSKAYDILISHGEQVVEKALAAADAVKHLEPNLELIKSASLLHDIGMIRTNVPQLGCQGTAPYIRHGVIGREMLTEIGLTAEALICERHVGAGISVDEICRNSLPLPKRDMLPVSIEEVIICYADKFFSKSISGPEAAKSPQTIVRQLAQHGPEQASRFKTWMLIFGERGKGELQ